MATLADVRTAIQERVDYDGAGLFTPAQLNQFVNNSAQDLHLLLVGMAPDMSYATAAVHYSISATSLTQTLPADFESPIRVQWERDGIGRPMRRAEWGDLVAYQQGLDWANELGPAYIVGWDVNGAPNITFTPMPSSAQAVTVFYRQGPPTYTQDSQRVVPYPEWIIRDGVVKALQRLRKEATQEIAERDKLTQLILNSPLLTDEANPPRVIDAQGSLWWRRYG